MTVYRRLCYSVHSYVGCNSYIHVILSGLYKLRIKHNPLADIPDEAFLGLERSLWELELPYNRLEKIPSKSFRHLQKLQLLDLTGILSSFLLLFFFNIFNITFEKFMIENNNKYYLIDNGIIRILCTCRKKYIKISY